MTAYDYGFRIYNPGIARFLSVDPLTKSYPWYSPYQFAGNSPLSCIDLDGLERYFAADGSYMGKYGASDEMRVLVPNSNYEELKSEGNSALINGSYPLSAESNDIYSKVATYVFENTVKDPYVDLYNDKISVE